MFQDRHWCETGVYHVPMGFQCIYGCSDEGSDRDGEEGKLPGHLYIDDLVSSSESEEDLRVKLGRFLLSCVREEA